MAQMETAFPDAKLPVPSYVMESSSNHPCHRLSIPAARLFWCRHCMQIFEDPITRWRHSKTCLNSSSRNVKKDRDGRTMQVFVNADNLSHCQREENKLKSVSRGVGTGKSPSADLRCRICKKTFLSIEEMRTHVRTPCRKRPSMGVAKHKYTARHKDMGAPIQIPDSTSEIIYIKDGHQTVFSLESQSAQPDGIKTEPVEPQPSNFKENAFQYGSCGEEDVIIIPDTFDNTSNLNTIEQTVEITAVEMVPPVVPKSDDIMKQSYKYKENKENNVRKRKRVIPKEIEERPNLKTSVTSSPKSDQQIIPAPLPSVTETPLKDVPEDVESPMVKIAKVMKDLEDLLLKQPTTENEVEVKMEELPSDDSKGLVTDNLPNDVITQLCDVPAVKVEISPDKDVSSDENAESCLKDLLFTSVKMKNQVKLSPKNVKSINLSALSLQKTSNSNSKCTVRKDLNKSSLTPDPQDNLCLDLFMPVNACSVTLPDPLLDIKNGMPAEVLLDETTCTQPPVAAALPESVSPQDSAELKEENKLPLYIFEGDLLPLQEHCDVLFEETTIDEKESSEESIIQPGVAEVKDGSSSSTDMVAAESEQPLDKVYQDKALVSTVSETLIKDSSVSEMITSEIPVEEIQAIPNEAQVTSLDSVSDKITEDDIFKVEEYKEIVQHSDLHLEDQQLDPPVEDQQPDTPLKDEQPDDVQLKDQRPDIQLASHQPDVEQEDQQPEVKMEESQAKENWVKENQVTEQPEEHQMEESKVKECKMEEYKVEKPHIKNHGKEHHQFDEVDEIPDREEELKPQEEESSRPKERKHFSGKHGSEIKLQKSPKLFKCKACSNTFKTAQALQKHSRVPCKVKHTRSLCQKILRPKRPCAKIEKKPVKKKIVKPPKRPKLMVPIVPITRQEVVRPATPKRPRRFSRRKRRKSSFIDEQKRILPFVNVLMSELSVKDLFFYKLGLINSSCKPTTSTSEIMSETLSICKLGKDKSLIVRRTSADLSPFDNNLDMTNSSVNHIDSALISNVFNDCFLSEGKRKPVVDNSYMQVLEPTTSVIDEDCFELKNHQNQSPSENDIEVAAASSVDISVPQANKKTSESDSSCQNQPPVLCKEENISLKKDSDLSLVIYDLKDSFTTDDKNKTCTDQSEPESLPVFHTSDSVKLLRKKLKQECSNPISILAQVYKNQHLSTNELHEPPTLDSSSDDDAKSKAKKHTVSEGDQYLTQKSEQQTTVLEIDNSSVNDNKQRTQTEKEPPNSSVVSSDISSLVSNETITQSNSLANLSRNSSLSNSLSPLVSSLKNATDITPATDKNSVFHSKSDLDSENKSLDVNSEKESSTSLPPSDIVDKNVRTDGLGVCLPNQRSQSPNTSAAESPTSDKHLNSEHLVDKHKPSNDASVSLCSTQPLHIETSNSSKKLDVSHSAKQRHFSDIFGNEKSSLVEKDNSNDQHCQISPSKERSKRHFTDFLSSLSENSVNNAQHPEPTHLSECALSKRDNISKACGNSSSSQIAKRSDIDPCVSCQHAADTAQNVNQTCHNARCVPEEAKNPMVDVNKSHQISSVKKRTHCHCSSAVPLVSIEPPNAMHRSHCPGCQHQVSNILEPSSADAGSISKSCLHTDNVSDSAVSSFDACTQGCPLKIQDSTLLHDDTHAAAHVSLRHQVSGFVSLPSSSLHMNMTWSTNVCRAALSADSSGDPCAFSRQTTFCVPLNSSTKTGDGTESPLQNSSSQHHHCCHHHHHHNSCIPTTPSTSSSSSSTSAAPSSSSSSSSSNCITSISPSTATICSTISPSDAATSSKDVHKPNITLNIDSITEVPGKKLTPTLCVAARNNIEHSNDCCSAAANALTIVVENADSSTTASNTNRIAVPASCSESSSSDTQTRCDCPGKFCLPKQKLKDTRCLGNNEDKLSVFCNCCSSDNNSSNSSVNNNNNNNNNIHQHHLHNHHHHNCNSNTDSSFLKAKGPLIPESVACLCRKRLETCSAVLKRESNVMSCKNPFQSRVVPSSVICVKRSLNPRISVATQTESSFLKEVKVVPAVSSTNETTKTCDSIKVTTDPGHSSSLQTCPKQIPESSSLEQQLTSEEVVQEEILLDANTLPVVGETLVNNQLPTARSEEMQYDTERKDSPVSNSLPCASDSTQLACSGKASNSVSSSPTNIPTSIGATELMAVSSVGSESNVYVQYVGEFDPSLLPEEVTFVIIQGDSGEGVPVADGQSLIIEGSGFEEPADGTSVPLQTNIPVAYELQQREDIAGDSECIVSEM